MIPERWFRVFAILGCYAIAIALLVGAAYRLGQGDYDIALCEGVVAAMLVSMALITWHVRHRKPGRPENAPDTWGGL